MLVSVLFSGVLVARSLVLASPVQPPVLAHESISELPDGWALHSEPLEEEILSLRVALRKSSDKILDIAQAVSNPNASQYGRHLSAAELREITDSDDSVACNAVQQWLQSHSIEDTTCDNGYVRFTTSVSNANRVLKSKFDYYQLDDNVPALRTKAYHLPQALVEHVDFVFPTVHFMSSGRKNRRHIEVRQHGIPTGPVTCGNSICPQNLTSRYNITYYPKDGSSGSKIGITGFIDNFPNQTDVNAFLRAHGMQKTRAANYSVQVIKDGPTKIPVSSALTVEPILDLDYSLAFTGPIPATFYTTGGKGVLLNQPGNKPAPANESLNEPYLDFFEALLAENSPPQVISISYSDDEQSVPIKYAQKVCNLIAQAAARGITVIGSSGDGGAAGTGSSNCIGPDGKHRLIPTFPSSCPWITSVGAVAPYGGPASYSSGGFSNYFSTPSWQTAATAGFIKELNGSHAGVYNASGRGIPDVSLLGDDYLIQVGGYNQTAKGTSASTPVFAAMIALLNDLRLRAGKPVLGHLNPLLYSEKFGPAFRDVISEFGTSSGCSDGNFVEGGWEALQGWDASTGLGEPDFSKLRSLLV